MKIKHLCAILTLLSYTENAYALTLKELATELGASKADDPIQYQFTSFAHPPSYCDGEHAPKDSKRLFCPEITPVTQETWDSWSPQALEAKGLMIVHAMTGTDDLQNLLGTILSRFYGLEKDKQNLPHINIFELTDELLHYKTVISSSLIGPGKLTTFGPIGVILEVPNSCLLAAYPKDIYSPSSDYELFHSPQRVFDSYLRGVLYPDHVVPMNRDIVWTRKAHGYTSHIKPAEEVLKLTAEGSYNELLIVPSSPTTGKRVRIKGFFTTNKWSRNNGCMDKERIEGLLERTLPQLQEAAEKLGLPIIDLDDARSTVSTSPQPSQSKGDL